MGLGYSSRMQWPRVAVEQDRSFTPPFCPRGTCAQHRGAGPNGFRFRHHGTYTTRRRGPIPRFVCLTCRRTFSRQSFATSYYLKRPELLVPVAAALLAGSAHRQIARSIHCAPSTVTRLSARLGRHCLLLLARGLRHTEGRLDESLVIDHFETFEFTQDFPFGVATAVGTQSWFVYALEPAPHRRTGRRSPAQHKRLLSRPRRAFRGGYYGSTWRLVNTVLPLAAHGKLLHLVGDGHPAYARIARRHHQASRLRLKSYPNPARGPRGSPRSHYARARDQAMFPVDLLHALLRHSLAHHRRETIAFGRRLNAIMERLFVAAVWRNFVKARSERKPDPTTPAMSINLTDRAWSWRRVLGRRLFPQQETVPPVWQELYARLWDNPLLSHNTRHARVLAY